MKFFAFVIASVLFITQSQAKNLILFIGDGMGPSVITAGRINKGEPIYFEKFPYTAFVRTQSTDSYVTDSAASATAIATGHKTRNRVVGFSAQEIHGKQRPKDLKTLSQIAKEKGMSVGIITDTNITDATPAAFYARAKNRANSEGIIKQLITANIDLAIGGGQKVFEKVERENKKFSYLKTFNHLQKVKDLKKPVIALFYEDKAPYLTSQKEKTHIAGKKIIRKAISLLSQNPKGFFLIVESGLIDKALHLNNLRDSLAHLKDLEESVEVAHTATKKNETLIVITADHDTGGIAINGYPSLRQSIHSNITRKGLTFPFASFATGPNSPYKASRAMHTGVDIHLFATGKEASNFHGSLHHTDTNKIMRLYLQK